MSEPVTSRGITNYGRPVGGAHVLEERTATLQFMPVVGGFQLTVTAISPDPSKSGSRRTSWPPRIDDVRNVLLKWVRPAPRRTKSGYHAQGAARKFLQKLAFAGFRLFQSIFAGPGASEPTHGRIGKWLRDKISPERRRHGLQVVSTGFPVPWPLMYLTERFDGGNTRVGNLLGMRPVVEQIPMAEIAALPPATTIESAPDSSVQALYNDTIDESMPSKPVAEQRTLLGTRGATLTRERPSTTW